MPEKHLMTMQLKVSHLDDQMTTFRGSHTWWLWQTAMRCDRMNRELIMPEQHEMSSINSPFTPTSSMYKNNTTSFMRFCFGDCINPYARKIASSFSARWEGLVWRHTSLFFCHAPRVVTATVAISFGSQAAVTQRFAINGQIRGHSFNTYAQIPGFQTHPLTLYAQIMTSVWQQYIGARVALDPPAPYWCVRNKWMAPKLIVRQYTTQIVHKTFITSTRQRYSGLQKRFQLTEQG